MHAVGGVAGGGFQYAQRVHHGHAAGGVPGALHGPRRQIGDHPGHVRLGNRDADAAGAARVRRGRGRRGYPYVPQPDRLLAGRHGPGFFELDAPVAVVFGGVEHRRRAAGGGHKLHAQIAIHDFDGRVLRSNGRLVGRLKAAPGDGHRTIETRAIGLIENILDSCEWWGGQRGRSQKRSRQNRTDSHEVRNPPADFSVAFAHLDSAWEGKR